MSLQPQSVEALQAAILGHNRLTIRGCGTKSAPLVGVGAATLESTNLRGITGLFS